MAAMYAVYHGPAGLRTIARRVSLLTRTLAAELEQLGYTILNEFYIDTIRVKVKDISVIGPRQPPAG